MYTQEGRPATIRTVLGDDTLLLVKFDGVEEISKPFVIHADLLSTDPAIDAQALLGQPAVITMDTAKSPPRYIHGLVRRFVQRDQSVRPLVGYDLEMVPWFSMLSLYSNCRIFQEKSVKAIVQEIFEDHGFKDFRFALTAEPPPREYCVQYRETDLDFVSRLLEEEGIFYFFEHTEDKHTLVLADAPSAIKPVPGQAQAQYETAADGWIEEDYVKRFFREEKVHTDKIRLRDFDFEKPTTDLTVSLAGEKQGEYYDYPGKYIEKGEGERYARIRLEREQATYATFHGSGNCRAFVPGFRFTLAGHYRGETNQDYTIISMRHTAGSNDYNTEESPEPWSYRNEFTAIPHSVTYRPARVTPRPVVEGPQTAIVTGKSGEEIWVDKHGRVQVRFHWDSASDSCWMRVAQASAGNGWGWVTLPRIGHEVIVEFLEGDPDRPIVVGSLYNAVQKPPYGLPDDQTKSLWKTNSSKGGGGFNEIRLEDKKGSEQIYIHAEKDMDIYVKNDRKEFVGKDRHLTVTGNKLESVTGNKNLDVKRDHNEKVGTTSSLKAGMDIYQKAGMKYGLDAGMTAHLKAGMSVVVEAGVSLTLKVGGSSISMSPANISITAPMVLINSGGAAGSGSGCSPKPPEAPEKPEEGKAGKKDMKLAAKKPLQPSVYGMKALAKKQASRTGAPFTS